ncbi:hypothetical protein [Cellulosimicrobium marinum]|uniref:hypothetical protein n=1 Tax=Cellulosimicrobium marinum TaxID=1638992 RepID=UPI001E6183FA|nr:hypothetical protein [Cellulosimicrobium marinum]MCB7137619.1 hypothetical protein [Cellulosimicrobium marinum]
MTFPPGAGPSAPFPSPGGGYPPPPPVRRSTRGATVLIVVGSVLLVLATGAGALGVSTFLRAVPTGVVDGAGGPGPDALASGGVPGEAQVSVVAGEPYSVWAVVPAGGAPFGADDVRVTCPDGALTVGRPSVSGSSGAGSFEATTVAEVTPGASQTCTVAVSGGSVGAGTTFVVTDGWRFGEFFATVGGTILLWFVAIGGGLLGLGLLVGGILWRVVARR